MASVLVSVVIPCYNQGHYLADAIRSVREQLYAPVEIIVVNDGSTDESAAIARAAGVSVISQENAGLGAARNRGLATARGEFVIFLDADDELLPDAVVAGVAALQANPRFSCVVRRCQVMDADRRALPAQYPRIEGNLYREWLRHNFVWTPGAALFRRARLVEIGGFPTGIPPACDYALYLALARSDEVLYQDRDAVRYRQHDSNMSRDPVLMLHATLGVLRRERLLMPARYNGDYRAALRQWRKFYGEQIVERLRRDWRSGEVGPWQRRAVLTLFRNCLGVVASHAGRKVVRVAKGLPSAPIEPGRFNREIVAPAARVRPS